MSRSRIALIGDYNPEVVAHRAIEACIRLAANSEATSVIPEWVATGRIVVGEESALAPFRGIWCVPASPYAHTEGALWAIQYARTRLIPFLGTCGGYQHALLEYARNALGLRNAGYTELDSGTPLPLLDRMQCGLIEASQKVVVNDPEFRKLYDADFGMEGYHCSYGLNPSQEHLFAPTPMQIAARSEDGQSRAFRLSGHPFFIGTQFQPERRALADSLHPLVRAFFTEVNRVAKANA